MKENNLGNVRLDDETQAKLIALLPAYSGKSDLIRAAINTLHAKEFPPAILGYVALDRRGDLDSDATCPQCGEPLTKPYLWFDSAGGFGVLCNICATSE